MSTSRWATADGSRRVTVERLPDGGEQVYRVRMANGIWAGDARDLGELAALVDIGSLAEIS